MKNPKNDRICIDDRWGGNPTGVGKRWRARVRDPHTRRYESKHFADKNVAWQWAQKRAAEFKAGVDTAQPAIFGIWGKRYLEHITRRAFTPRYLRQVEVAIERLVEAGARDMRDQAFADSVERCVSKLTTAKKGGVIKKKVKGDPRPTLVPTAKPAAAATKNLHLTVAKAVCDWARMNRAIPYNPLEILSPFTSTTELRRIFSVTELKQLVEEREKNDPWRIFAALLVYTGARSTEVRSMTWSMINWEAGVIILPGHAKGNKLKIARTIPLQEELRAILSPIAQVGSAPIVADHIQELSTGSTTRGFQDYCKRRGIDAAGRGPHCLRHTFCALMTALDVNSFVTMSIVGHLEPATARWYSQRAMEVRPQVVAWPRGDFHILREAKLDEAKFSPQELAMLQMLRKALKTG